MSQVSASIARQTLPSQLDKVEAGEEVEITRHGRVVAVLVNPQALRVRRTSEVWVHVDELNEKLAQARKSPVLPPALTSEQAEALVAAVREDRDST